MWFFRRPSPLKFSPTDRPEQWLSHCGQYRVDQGIVKRGPRYFAARRFRTGWLTFAQCRRQKAAIRACQDEAADEASLGYPLIDAGAMLEQ